MWIIKLLDYLKPKLPEFIKRSFLEEDGKTVSSSRIMGGLTFVVLHFCNVVLVSAISWSIIKVMKLNPIDNVALASLLGSIKYLSLLYLILAATALALYGVNIWKYVASIRSGINSKADEVAEEVEKEVQKDVKTVVEKPVVKEQTEKPEKDDL